MALQRNTISKTKQNKKRKEGRKGKGKERKGREGKEKKGGEREGGYLRVGEATLVVKSLGTPHTIQPRSATGKLPTSSNLQVYSQERVKRWPLDWKYSCGKHSASFPYNSQNPSKLAILHKAGGWNTL